jgi:PIF1-like helicase/Helitron helicase-like domain at N-terminus/Helicase
MENSGTKRGSQGDEQTRYATPNEAETPNTKRRRLQNRRQARYRAQQTHNEAERPASRARINLNESFERMTVSHQGDTIVRQSSRVSTVALTNTQDIYDAYPTPQDESPASRLKRKARARAARSRMHKRRMTNQEEKCEEPGLEQTITEQGSNNLALDHVANRVVQRGLFEEEDREEKCDEPDHMANRVVQREPNQEEDREEKSEEAYVTGRVVHIQRRGRRTTMHRLALAYHEEFNESFVVGDNVVGVRHVLPPMDKTCRHCNALKWPTERHGLCCLSGKVILASFEDPPQLFKDLFTQRPFMMNIRKYNSLFAFTSLGASVTDPLQRDTSVGTYTFRIQGALCHRIGTLLPPEGRQPAFAQLYVFDTNFEDQATRRHSIMQDLCIETIRDIQRLLLDVNPFAKVFRMAAEYVPTAQNARIVIRENIHGLDYRRFNRPTADDVAALLIDDGATAEHRDIILHKRDGGLTRIFESYAVYDPLQYPLLFPYGQVGWCPNANVSTREFVAFYLFTRPGKYSAIHNAGRLFQQYCVDQYAKVEQQRLLYHRTHQNDLRAELYKGLEDMAAGDHDLRKTGKRVILAPSFTGGDRYMQRQYQDSMAIVRAFGKPDLFITVTCNPKWPDIKAALLPGQTPSDRPDIVARVFHQKLKSIVDDVTKKGLLGKTLAHVYVIEFQKRGLPHAHMLIILCDEDKPRTPDDYDKFVSAEIPDKIRCPTLNATVTTCMIHGPCGAANPNAVCMKDGVCSKGFPKPYAQVTQTNANGYPVYRRRDQQVIDASGRVLSNAWVVPYNPYLSTKYNCHINVEICSTISSVKYLYKYVYKGHDRAAISITKENENGNVEEINEIDQYVTARYISASESCWRLLNLEMQHKSHTIQVLQVHMPGGNMVTFDPEGDVERVLEQCRHTTLTRFFELAQVNDLARTLLYYELPKHFVWKKNGKHWHPRQKGGEKAIGRMISCSPADKERYHLRMLLCYQRGPTSFDDLKTVNGTVHETFEDAARAAGLLEDDSEWIKCMQEAISFQMPYQLRQLFAIILSLCGPGNIGAIWQMCEDHLMEDHLRTTRMRFSSEPEEKQFNRAMWKTLMDIDCQLQGNSKSLTDFPRLPQISSYVEYAYGDCEETNSLRRSETSYDPQIIDAILLKRHQLNGDQGHVFRTVTAAVNDANSSHKLFFLDGPGGTGKSFTIEMILAHVRKQKKIALAVASSGIAALLLTGGKTAHSRFKLPLDLSETTTCNIPGQSDLATLLHDTSIIVWDEAPMAHRIAIEAVDRTLQDIMKCDEPFGGKTILLAGDFRQVLPVVPKASDAQIIKASIKKSYLWRHFQQLKLAINMRVQITSDSSHAAEIQDFADFLLRIGDARHETCPLLDKSFVKLPNDIVLRSTGTRPATLKTLISSVYENIESNLNDEMYLTNRAILTPLNIDAQKVNDEIMDSLPGTAKEYLSIDSIEDPDCHQHHTLPPEFLNTLVISGMPTHKLRLKVGAPVMLMRNINGEQGLCNGTRMRICQLTDNCMRCVILTGSRKGEKVFIPRITLISRESGLPFQLRRRQFPVQVAFAMTINKAQGQSVHHLGLFIPNPVFGHGQLYVALSRVTSRKNVKILILNPVRDEPDGTYTKNVVFKEIVR